MLLFKRDKEGTVRMFLANYNDMKQLESNRNEKRIKFSLYRGDLEFPSEKR